METTAGIDPNIRNRGDGQFPCFDGLRAIAALSIVVTHVAALSGATLFSAFALYFKRMEAGVGVFFVLSGFLLYRPFVLAHLQERPRPAAGPFLWRRFLRIFPAYWVVLTAILVVFQYRTIDSIKDLAINYTLVTPYFGNVFPVLTPAWTLSIEVAFYVFIPIWAFLVTRRPATSPRGRLRRELIGVAILFSSSLVWKLMVLHTGLSDARIFQLRTWLPWWLDLFAVGMLLAVGNVAVHEVGWRGPLRMDRKWAPAVCWLLAAASFWVVSEGIGLHAAVVIPLHFLIPMHYLYGLTAALLVLPAVFGPQTRDSSLIRRFLTTRVMVYLGVVSYGIYLWHVPWSVEYLDWSGVRAPSFIWNSGVPLVWHTSDLLSVPFLAMLAAVMALTIGAASASWFLVERPVLKLKRRFSELS